MQPTVKINDLIAKTFYPVMEDILDEKHTDYWLKGGRSSTKIYEIELEDGRTIKASGEHPVLTRRGWVLARDLTEHDEILEVQI